MERIIEILAQEDKDRLFTGDSHPNIYDAIASINNPTEIKEIERSLKYYFEQMIQIASENSTIQNEAKRMLMICDKIFPKSENLEVDEVLVQSSRNLSDEIVDFYMESLKHFASYVEEDILNEHIKYLEDV